MKDFQRKNLLFSLCGLNCGLCPMNLNGYCPGCGGGKGNQSCSIAKCSLKHDNVEYCFQCENYPCEKYEHIDEFDSFITHQHQKQDMKKMKRLGTEGYVSEQKRKRKLLEHLLDTYNDGRKKTLFCVAVTLLELDDLENIICKLDQTSSALGQKEKASLATSLLRETAEKKQYNIKIAQEKVRQYSKEGTKWNLHQKLLQYFKRKK